MHSRAPSLPLCFSLSPCEPPPFPSVCLCVPLSFPPPGKLGLMEKQAVFCGAARWDRNPARAATLGVDGDASEQWKVGRRPAMPWHTQNLQLYFFWAHTWVYCQRCQGWRPGWSAGCGQAGGPSLGPDLVPAVTWGPVGAAKWARGGQPLILSLKIECHRLWGLRGACRGGRLLPLVFAS